MTCSNCGRQNDADALYCQKCGRLLEAEVETRVAARTAPPAADPPRFSPVAGQIGDEREIFAVSPTLKFVKAGYAAAVLTAFLLVVLLSLWPAVPVWAAVIVGLLLLLVPGFYHLRRSLVRYRLTDCRIEIGSGLIAQTSRSVPLGRIQDVTVARSIPQRLLGMGDIIIDNASEEGGKVVLKDIDSPRDHADQILAQMRRLGR
ncbi:MAG: PH domain-containing protein [Pyrinomonadaceae bacterium]